MSNGRWVEDQWDVVTSVLPPGWQDAARETGATRIDAHGPLSAPEVFLRTILGYVAANGTYADAAIRLKTAGLVTISEVGLFKGLARSPGWLEWIADRMLGQTLTDLPPSPLRLRLVDATAVCRHGSNGTDYRLHVSVRLPERTFVQAELTDVKGGESFTRFDIQAGDVMVADRAYGTAKEIQYVDDHDGDVVVRMNVTSLPLYAADDSRIDPLGLARGLLPGQSMETDVQVRPKGGNPIVGRLCIYAMTPDQAEKAQRQTKRKKKNKGPIAMESAKYVFVFTTLTRDQASTEQVLAIYRLRWQVELAFKTLKTVLKFGALPHKLPETCRAWLLGKLVCALILERLAAKSRERFPPSGQEAQQHAA